MRGCSLARQQILVVMLFFKLRKDSQCQRAQAKERHIQKRDRSREHHSTATSMDQNTTENSQKRRGIQEDTNYPKQSDRDFANKTWRTEER
jgi:hypothetical protein